MKTPKASAQLGTRMSAVFYGDDSLLILSKKYAVWVDDVSTKARLCESVFCTHGDSVYNVRFCLWRFNLVSEQFAEGLDCTEVGFLYDFIWNDLARWIF